MHANDSDIDRLFEAVSKEGEALEALEDAVTQLKTAHAAKAVLARLDAPRLRQGILRRSGRLGGGHP
ncbi:hypothetical protein IFT73_00780 [Aeromicrobium sp. CFBP 8757]|uniref:hypothetical protein n=1 Tax=Aeromicrobium sp. CFBP 8757 TaxID=2775288 RepID=UPI0017875973|nr:hypothetical protein [Aeromicrobium sp. CFBP 8757]MBD8605372.1 hypothetical protein [Aeromicrobium sp. CFBP 8757]